jgi:gliding motility-associated-like protein
MENKFDKEIQELFKAYEEQPSANCWDKVSSQLDAMPDIPDASQGSAASSANTSAFSQFVGSVAGKITIAVTSVAAIGGLSYLIVTSGSQDSSQTRIDTASNVEVLVEDKYNKEDNTITTIVGQPEDISNNVEKPVTIQKNSISQEKQQIHKEENKNIDSPNSVLENNQISQNQPIIAQAIENEAKNQSKGTEKQQLAEKQETVKPKQEKKETPEKQEVDQEKSDIQKEEIINEKPSIDVLKIPISNLLTPNGDGHNDYFIVGNIDEYPENNLIVFDRNGKVVYEKANYRNEWNGENIPDGVYFYMFSFTHEGRTFMRRGSITVKR